MSQGDWIYFRMNFPSPLQRGTLIRRYRRFLADVRLDGGRTVTAHCPSPGMLRGCSEPGSAVLLSDSGDSRRRHRLTWEITDLAGSLVCVNAPLCRRLLLEAVAAHAIPIPGPFSGAGTAAPSGTHRSVDLFLHGMERNAFVNLFTATWAREGTALFPDAPGGQAGAALRHLADIARGGHLAVSIFLVARGDCTCLKPAEELNRPFMKAMLEARSAGVELLAYAARVTPDGVSLGDPLSVLLS